MPAPRCIDTDDLKLCNCAGCRCELIGERQQEELSACQRRQWPALAQRLGRVAGRISGRPYCDQCFRERKAWDETWRYTSLRGRQRSH